MKKFVSFFMVAVMLVSMLALSVSAEQTNMEVTVPKFTSRPTFDGVVSEEEWGTKTLRMVTDGAATELDTEIGYNEELGLKNIFYYFAVEGICDTLAYDLWIRWDDEYLYVAAIVDDPDPFSLPAGGEEIWNGDMIQIRVDDAGPSAIMLAGTPDFNYKTDAFNGVRYKKPWSNDKENFNGIMGLVKGSANDNGVVEGSPTFWRCGKTYGEGWDLTNDGALVGITSIQNEDGTCTTTYEGAIPWSAINATLVPSAGATYGMCVSVACSDSNELNGWLQWGHGVTSVDENVQPRGTRGGSQAIVLSDESITPSDDYKKADETTAPAETTAEPDDDKADDDKANENVANTTAAENNNKKPANTTVADDSGIPTVAIVGIVVVVLAIVAVVVIIILKKKKK